MPFLPLIKQKKLADKNETGDEVKITASPVWWAHQDLNLGPLDYESSALTN